MRRIQLSAIFLLLFAFGTGLASAQKSYKEIKYPKLHEIKIPKVEEVRLKNGMRLFLLEDHELPLVHASARIRVGSVYDPPDKVGLASITGTVMRSGGTKKLSGDQIDDILESLAASVETSIGLDVGSAYMSSLKEDFDRTFAIFADILMEPAFPQDKLDLAKIEQRSMIARRNDDPNQIAFREFRKLIYGPHSVYARHPEYETIDRITREDLIAFHKKYFHPNNVILAIWGDFNKKDIVRKVEGVFQDWKPAKIEFPKLPEVRPEYRKSVNLVRKADASQSNILMGHLGGTMDDPDYFALVVMNRILGEGFTSRLFRNVRSRQGLAYSVFGGYSANFSYPGLFYVGCQTKTQSTVKAIRAIEAEVKRITEEEVTDEELKLAKESYLNSFVFNFDSRRKIIGRILNYAYYGYPLDFLQKVKKNVEKVTKADVLRAARSHLHPDGMKILVVGNDKGFDEPLSVLGPVNEIDITIPVPKAEKPKASKEAMQRGEELLKKVVSACGDPAAIAAIQSVEMKAKLVVSTPQGDMQMNASMLLVYPDRLLNSLKTPMGEIKQVLSGQQAWMVGPQGTMDLPESQRAEMRKSLYRSYISLIHLAALGQLQAQDLGKKERDGRSYTVLLVSHPETGDLQLGIDPESFLPAWVSYQGVGRQGPVQVETRYSDYQSISGIKVPMKVVSFAGGKKESETNIESVRFNVPVDSSLFEKAK